MRDSVNYRPEIRKLSLNHYLNLTIIFPIYFSALGELHKVKYLGKQKFSQMEYSFLIWDYFLWCAISNRTSWVPVITFELIFIKVKNLNWLWITDLSDSNSLNTNLDLISIQLHYLNLTIISQSYFSALEGLYKMKYFGKRKFSQRPLFNMNLYEAVTIASIALVLLMA